LPNAKEYINDPTLLSKLMNWDMERAVGLPSDDPIKVFEHALENQAKLIPEEVHLVDDLMRLKSVMVSNLPQDFAYIKKESENLKLTQ
jgi:hypothetical protein